MNRLRFIVSWSTLLILLILDKGYRHDVSARARSSHSASVISVVATLDSGNTHINLTNCSINNNQKLLIKQRKKNGNNGVFTAADMYESGFRIKNMGLCSTQTRLLVLITSAAAPSHAKHRHAIRMTWMNRYGPGVRMAFLVGTPQMPKTDPVAQELEAEERALRIRLSGIDNNNNINPKVDLKPPVSSGGADILLNPLNTLPGWHRFLKDLETNTEEGLDAHAMDGLNEAEQAVQRVLVSEYGRYGDLIQCQVRDTYYNLTLKSIAALEWTRQYCPWARYLLKTDDDMFIDVRRLLRFIDKVEVDAIKEAGISGSNTRSNKPIHVDSLLKANADVFEAVVTPKFNFEMPPTIWGRLAHEWPPIRQHDSKYYVSRTQYAGRVYPDFCTGPAYLMTRSTVSPLYEAALDRDFDVVDEFDNHDGKGYDGDEDLKKDCIDGNQKLAGKGDKISASFRNFGKNTVPYLQLEDVYLTGVVAERLTRRAAERLARQVLKGNNNSLDGIDHGQIPSAEKLPAEQLNKNTRSKTSDIIVEVRRINDNQFANIQITGGALDRVLCSDASPGNIAGSSRSGFSWFNWYWGNTAVDKETKNKKKDEGVISLHMVEYSEQFSLWSRLLDGQTKCKS